ncbi:MAG TPA: hypothetical protein VH333_06000 [Pseudonocardiaceae bacterium]|jgi:hypothetical protein|nr:hypothetical protein [Pseudonocardiaceae bacterium]
MRHPVKRGADHDPIPSDDVMADPTVTTGPPPDSDSDLVPVDMMPRYLRQTRLALLVEGVVLIGWGAWGLVAALADRHAGVSGPTVLVVQLTWPHAVLLMVTGAMAILVGGSYHWTLRFTVLQAVGYGVLFLVGAGHHNWFADPVDDLLHAVLALVGLVLLLWTAVRGLGGFGWTRRQADR